MIRGVWLLAWALGSAAGSSPMDSAANGEVAAVFVKANALYARQIGVDAWTASSLDRSLESLAPAVLKWKWHAVGPLDRVLADPTQPIKIRVYALSLLALTHDPAAYPAVRRALLDHKNPETLRSASASALTGLRISPRAMRAAICASLSPVDTVPETLLRQLLIESSRLGCDRADMLEILVQAFGPRPLGRQRELAGLAISTVRASHPPAAAETLARLLRFYPPHSDLKPLVLKALRDRLTDVGPGRLRLAHDLSGLLLSESDDPAVCVAAIELLPRLNLPDSPALLLRILENPDAEVATAAAEALAKLQVVEARDKISDILAHAHEDARFAPAQGRPKPEQLVERLQAAVNRLR